MMMTNRHEHPVFAAAAEQVIDDLDPTRALSATEVLAWKSWFDARRGRLRSSGGRPTEPSWSIKRQIPFAPEVWDMLGDLARLNSKEGHTVGPGQLAGFILEEAVRQRSVGHAPPPKRTRRRAGRCDLLSSNPRFASWTMPALFSGDRVKT
jgi:hypothetical protein